MKKLIIKLLLIPAQLYLAQVPIQDYDSQANSAAGNQFGDGNNNFNQLQVELVNFRYSLINEEILFEWETLTETNSFMFELQRLNRATNVWEKRGHVLAFGTSNSPKFYKYLEHEPIEGTSIYRLKIIDLEGSYAYSEKLFVTLNHLFDFVFYQNFTNPYNHFTRIGYSLPEKCDVTIEIMSTTGQTIQNLIGNTLQKAGNHEVTWNVNNLSPGIYYIKMTAQPVNQNTALSDTKKIIYIK